MQTPIIDTRPLGAQDDLGRRADHRITLAQIGSMVLASCGARDYLHDDKTGMVKFRIGARGGMTGRWCTIRLMADDTYSIEIGRIKRGTFDWVVDLREDGIYAEDMPRAVRRCADREF